MKSEEIHYKSIIELAGMISTKEISPLDVTTAILNRIRKMDPQYKSYATVMEGHAMDAARHAEKEIASGNYKGLLHGIPIAVKDLCFTAGVKTMGGCKVLADHTPDFDATVVSRLEASGAVLMGKLNLTEGAMGGYNPEFDVPVNPWGANRWAGSSSSGSGVATALGLCYGSLGSDTGGSIRYPAAACGTVGLKPTWGRVSRYGVLPLAESLDHVGPLTRTSADAGIMLMAISGFDTNDPTTLSETVPDMLEDINGGVKGLRIGVNERYISDGVDEELSKAVMAAVHELSAQGAHIVDIDIPDVEKYMPFWRTICTAEAAFAHREHYPSRRDEYGPFFQGWLDIGASVTAADYIEANNMRNECNGLLRTAMQNVDVIACPSMIGPAHEITLEQMYGPLDPNRNFRSMRFTVPYDYNGFPTLSVPCGFSNVGLPLSIQFVGRPLSEALLCRIGQTYENVTEWHSMHPVI
jgi:amidase